MSAAEARAYGIWLNSVGADWSFWHRDLDVLISPVSVPESESPLPVDSIRGIGRYGIVYPTGAGNTLEIREISADGVTAHGRAFSGRVASPERPLSLEFYERAPDVSFRFVLFQGDR